MNDAWSHKYNLELRLSGARQDAERAWKGKDFKGVIEAFEPLRESLKPHEIKKLEYARKKLEE